MKLLFFKKISLPGFPGMISKKMNKLVMSVDSRASLVKLKTSFCTPIPFSPSSVQRQGSLYIASSSERIRVQVSDCSYESSFERENNWRILYSCSNSCRILYLLTLNLAYNLHEKHEIISLGYEGWSVNNIVSKIMFW